jgi:hypothetical protein
MSDMYLMRQKRVRHVSDTARTVGLFSYRATLLSSDAADLYPAMIAAAAAAGAAAFAAAATRPGRDKTYGCNGIAERVHTTRSPDIQ